MKEGKNVNSIIHTLDHRTQKSDGLPNFALADFIAPTESEKGLYGIFAVTAGIGIESLIEI